MNPLSKFGLTDEEINAEIARDPEALNGLKDLARRVEESLKDKAPVFDPVRDRRKAAPHPEDPFKDSIHTELVRRKDGLPGARVGSNHYLALAIEVGNVHMPEMAIFAQTAAEFGDTTGPVFSEGVQEAQGNLREQLKTLAKMKGESPDRVAAQQRAVRVARSERSAAFKASRRGRR